jgi:hypothetical protein
MRNLRRTHDEVDDPVVLRRARALLRIVTRERIIPSHARAFATITMALNRLEDGLRPGLSDVAAG